MLLDRPIHERGTKVPVARSLRERLASHFPQSKIIPEPKPFISPEAYEVVETRLEKLGMCWDDIWVCGPLRTAEEAHALVDALDDEESWIPILVD